MKKLGIIMTALFAVVAFSTVSFAADVQVTLTSPVIVKDGCERAGAVNFSFPEGTTFTAGDWWFMDINTANVTICSPLDYMIAEPGNAGAAAGIDIGPGKTAATFAGLGLGLAAQPDYGPISVELDGVAYAAPGGNEATMAFLVTAVENSNRVLIEVIGSAATDTFTVPVDHTLKLKILDGKKWNDITLAGATPGADTVILTNVHDLDGTAGTADDDVYGEDDGSGNADLIDLSDDDTDGDIAEPAKANTLCINAEGMSGSIVYTSFASKLDFLTFTGDSQIAHTGSATAISFDSCKGDVTDNIEPGGQGACEFEYENGFGYCPGFSGNMVIVGTNSTFGQDGDKYDLAVSILTNGVYFSANPAVLGYESDEDACDGGGNVITPAWELWAGTDNEGVGFAGSPDCAIDADERIDTVKTSGGLVADLWEYNAVQIDLQPLFYDTSIQGPGEVEIQVSISKYPCGDLFEDTLVIGTFVEECASAASTTLVFPYMPPLDGSAVGWWAGYVITNGGSSAGTIMITYRDSEGNTGTYTTDSLAAGAMFNGTMITAADLSGADDFNASDNYSIVASCNFGGAVGFAFIGNGKEGTGYAVD